MDTREYEARLKQGDATSRKLKRQGFDDRMARVDTAIRTAKTESEKKRFEKIRGYSLDRYNKYNNSDFKN
jgi:ribosome biogenesis SPOUT family RNA methylase Rps3